MSAGDRQPEFDVVIVGAGISGALVAKFLGQAGRRVLVLEAGDGIEPNSNDALERYYHSTSKAPESPYTPELFVAACEDPNDPIQRLTQGNRSDQAFQNPSSINAGRPTVLSISLRAWQEPHKLHWTDADSKKCDPKNIDVNYLDQSTSPLPFASTYERTAGGTARHWMGISLRHLPNDFMMGKRYGSFSRNGKQCPWPNWPIGYAELDPWYARAEGEIGVSGDAAAQKDLEKKLRFPNGNLHAYPMAGIPASYADKSLSDALKGSAVTFPARTGHTIELELTPLPVARNSEPFNRRRACAGNSSCIPICPIQAKYDPTITLREALNTGQVVIEFRAVACDIVTSRTDKGQAVTQIEYIKYEKDVGGLSARYRVSGKDFVLAANAIETPRLLLMSNGGKGILPAGVPVGHYLMDHPFLIASARSKTPVYSYRGPLVTSGIETLRDGEFRHRQASFRVDVSNSGWTLTSHGQAQTLAEDFITGGNESGMNPEKAVLGGPALVGKLHDILTTQVSLGFLVEQTPDFENQVTLSENVDGLGLPRPRINYDFSDYTKDGLAEAMSLANRIFDAAGFEKYPDDPTTKVTGDTPPATKPGDKATAKKKPADACSFEWKDAETGKPVVIRYMGAGHIAGTCRMGTEADRATSVVDRDLKAWGIDNLYIVGSAVFPTLGTANPTLTIAALALRLADHLREKSV